MKKESKNSALLCFVCKKDNEEILKLNINSYKIYGLKTYLICQSCVESLSSQEENFENSKKKKKNKNSLNIGLTPSEIFSLMEGTIIGQDQAKKDISVAIANHLQRLNNPSSMLKKSNVLIMGPTGTGKTEIARTISEKLNIPFVIVDATTLTQHGFAGDDVESILISLYQKANGNLEIAEKGIVFIDEIDKISAKEQSSGVNSTAVQRALLKMIEGGNVRIPKSGLRKDVGNEMVVMNTENILFIGAGAFEGINSAETVDHEQVMVEPYFKNNNSTINEEQIIEYGFLPEFLGRFSIVTHTRNLTFNDLKNILLNEKISLLNQYKLFLAEYNVELIVEDSFIDFIVYQAIKSQLGVRGLRKELEVYFKDILFEIPGSEYKIIQISANGYQKFVDDKKNNNLEILNDFSD